MKPQTQPGRVNDRRINTLQRLKQQLVSNTKQNNKIVVSLTPNDVVRIQKEITTLESRITTDSVALSKRSKKYRGVRKQLTY